MNLTVFNAFCFYLWSGNRSTVKYFLITAFISFLCLKTNDILFLNFFGEMLKYCILVSLVCFTLVIFSYGKTSDYGSKASKFPRHLFSLPVSNLALTAWPMFCGAMVMLASWFAIDLLLLKANSIEKSFWWPALLLVGLLFWVQAFSWRAYRYNLFPLLFITLASCGYFFFSAYIIINQDKSSLILSLLIVQLLVAFFMSFVGVKRSRLSYEPKPWSWAQKIFCNKAFKFLASDKPFTSPLQAQMNIEFRIHGLLMPFLAFVFGLISLLACFFGNRILVPGDIQGAMEVLGTSLNFSVFFLFATIIFAFIWGSYHSKSWAATTFDAMDEMKRIPSFISTLPITNNELVKAKFLAYCKNISVAFSILLFFIVLIFTLACMSTEGLYSSVMEGIDFRNIVLVVLALILVVVNSLGVIAIDLHKKSKYLQIVMVLMFVMPYQLISYGYVAAVIDYLPLILGVLSIFKLLLLARFLPWLVRNKHYQRATLIKSVLVWAGFILISFSSCVLLLPSQVSTLLIITALVCGTPILSLLAAPLMLKTTRSR